MLTLNPISHAILTKRKRYLEPDVTLIRGQGIDESLKLKRPTPFTSVELGALMAERSGLEFQTNPESNLRSRSTSSEPVLLDERSGCVVMIRQSDHGAIVVNIVSFVQEIWILRIFHDDRASQTIAILRGEMTVIPFEPLSTR
jgi:hypothetical protein